MQTEQSYRNETPSESWKEREAISINELFSLLWTGRWWIFGSIALFAVIFIIAGFMTTPIYRARAILAPANVDQSVGGTLGSALGQLGGLGALVGINIDSGNAQTQESLAVLSSRQFTERFIHDRNLMPRLFTSRWDVAAGRWKGDEEDWPTSAQAYRYFDKKIRSVTQDKKTNLVSLQIEWRDRNEAADWANRLIRQLNSEMRSRAISKADASVGFLKKELESTVDIGTREAINRLIETQVKQRMLASVTEEYAFRVVDTAMAPDRKDVVRPKKFLMLLIGGALGLTLGVLAALFFKRTA